MASFSVLTWNLALGGPSVQAPTSVDTEANLFSMLDIIELHDPDFVCLQEMPSAGFVNYLSNDYVSGQPVRSHSGYSAVFVRKGPVAGQPIQLESQLNLPPVTGISLHIGEQFLIIFSVHLPPFKKNANQRLAFLSGLFSQLSGDHPLIFAGDCNMREAETDGVVELGLSDAYQNWSDPDRSQYATWDSILNRYHDNNFEFRARFDRVFYRGVKLKKYELIGDKPVFDPPYYYSDHFGILSEFSFH